MRSSEWSDSELEELLRQMPKIQDHRNPRDIYQNLSLKKRKTKTWLFPTLAAAVVLLLFFILVPKFMHETNHSLDTVQQDRSSDMGSESKGSSIALKKAQPSQKGVTAEPTGEKENQSGFLHQSTSTTVKTAIYNDQVGNGTVLTYWIPDPQAQILIPVSTIIPESKNESWITLFIQNMANLKEEEWGLTDFYPLKMSLKVDEKDQGIIVDVPENQPYGQGGTNETNFMSVIQKDVSSNSNSKKIKFTTNNQPGIELGNFGRIEEVEVNKEKKHAFFFYYPEGSDLPFLTPSNETYKNLSAALEAMKNDQPNIGLKASLKPLLPIDRVTINDKTLFISFKGNESLSDNQPTLYSFEAFLLTAKEFGVEKVVVKDSLLTHIGSFDLSKEIMVPIAPNFRTLP